MKIREVLTVLLASVILGFSVSFPKFANFFTAAILIFIVISLNVLAKKLAAYYFDSQAKIKFWDIYHFSWQKKSHFKKPLPLFWISPLISLISLGYIWWLAILEFEIDIKPERVSRRHGFYRYTEITDWELGYIAAAGVISNFLLFFLGYLINLPFLSKLSIYFAVWSLIPVSSLDGTKILAGGRILWVTLAIIAAILLSFSFFIV